MRAGLTGAGQPGGRTTFGEPTARPDTLADRREFLTAGLHPVRCGQCGTEVLAAKHSADHTSIQWTGDAAAQCPVYRELAATGGSPARADTCPHLRAALTDAVRAGTLPIGEP